MLWKDLKPSAGATLQQSKPIDLFLQVPEVIRAEARAMLNAEQRQAFWLALVAKHPNLTGANVRRANSGEIRYYWATIPFDIEEPFFAIDAGPDRFIANFSIENGNPVLFWIDRIGDLKTLGSALPAKDADTAALDAVTEMVLPAGWKRYRFAYDGGLTLSILMPQPPQERAGPAQIASDVPITLMGRTLTSNSQGMVFSAFYTSQLSRTYEQLSEKEKNSVLAAMAGPWLNGMVKAMRQAGNQVDPKSGPMKTITIGDYQGVEQDISIPPFQCRVRTSMVGQYSYGVLALWRTGAPEDLPKTFIESLRIEK
jgi:hypothetical protein